MKKILFSAAFFAVAIGASAIDEVAFEPTTFQMGKTAVVKVILNTTTYNNEMQNILFDVELPKGWAISTSATSVATNTARTVGQVWDVDFEEWVASSDMAISIVKQANSATGNPVYRMSLQSQDLHPLSGNEGWIFSFTAKAANDAVAGYYPIKIINAYMNKDAIDANNVVFGNVGCYFKVGEPANGELALEGTIPSFVNAALAAETGLASLDLSAATAVYGDFTYVDGRAVAGTSATADVKYVGNKANYYSVNVPFTGAATGEFYELKSVDENFAVFSTATTVKAGETYLAKGEVTLTANAAVATIENKENQTGSYVYEGMFYTGKNLTVPATRGLFKEVPAGSNLRVVIDGELTGITTAEIDAQAGNTYDLQGRQSVNAKNGVFVVNGKKQFVK